MSRFDYGALPELIAELDNPNLMVRMKAMEQVIARGDNPATMQASSVCSNKARPGKKLTGCGFCSVPATMRQGLDKLRDGPRSAGSRSCQRIFTEHSDWNERPAEAWPWPDSRMPMLSCSAPPRRHWARIPRRRICAAVGIASASPSRGHPSDASGADELCAISLRAHQRLADQSQWSKQDSRALADVCLGVHDVPSAQFLQHHLSLYTEPTANVLRYGHYIARFGSEGSGSWALNWANKNIRRI